jgi:hypothetical protein
MRALADALASLAGADRDRVDGQFSRRLCIEDDEAERRTIALGDQSLGPRLEHHGCGRAGGVGVVFGKRELRELVNEGSVAERCAANCDF